MVSHKCKSEPNHDWPSATVGRASKATRKLTIRLGEDYCKIDELPRTNENKVAVMNYSHMTTLHAAHDTRLISRRTAIQP